MRSRHARISSFHPSRALVRASTLVVVFLSQCLILAGAFAEPNSAEFANLAPRHATRVQGQVILSSGQRVANAAVYIANSKLANLFDNKSKKPLAHSWGTHSNLAHHGEQSQHQINCNKPSIPVLSFTCSDGDGRFDLVLPSLPTLPLVVTVQKENLSINIALSLDELGGDVGEIALDSAIIEEQLDRIAIVDKRLPDIVKSSIENDGLNDQRNAQHFMDSEFLMAYGLDYLQSNVEYPGFDALFVDADGDGRIDIYNYAAVLLKTSWKTGLAKMDATKKQVLLDYVENGGQLFITNKPQSKRQSLEGFI